MAAKTNSTPSSTLRRNNSKKSKSHRDHSSNFRAGYVPINEEYLHKTGIRGKKRFLVYFIIALVVTVALLNLLVTLYIFYKLQIHKNGLSTLEFVAPGFLLRFLGDCDLVEQATIMQNQILSLPDEHLSITGIEDNSVHINATDAATSVSISTEAIHFQTGQHFKILDPDTGLDVFSTDFSRFKFPDEMESISLKKAVTSRIASPVEEDLLLQSDQSVNISGNGGILFDTRKAKLIGQREIIFSGENLNFESESGTYFTDTKKLPKSTENPGTNLEETYKLCVCMPSGTLFTVSSPNRCDQVSENGHPCL